MRSSIVRQVYLRRGLVQHNAAETGAAGCPYGPASRRRAPGPPAALRPHAAAEAPAYDAVAIRRVRDRCRSCNGRPRNVPSQIVRTRSARAHRSAPLVRRARPGRGRRAGRGDGRILRSDFRLGRATLVRHRRRRYRLRHPHARALRWHAATRGQLHGQQRGGALLRLVSRRRRRPQSQLRSGRRGQELPGELRRFPVRRRKSRLVLRRHGAAAGWPCRAAGQERLRPVLSGDAAGERHRSRSQRWRRQGLGQFART